MENDGINIELVSYRGEEILESIFKLLKNI